MDARQRDAVDDGLGAAQRLEDRERPLPHRRAQARALEHPAHLAVGAAMGRIVRVGRFVGMRVPVSVGAPADARARRAGDLDPHVARRERPASHTRHPQPVLHSEPGKLAFEHALRKPEVEQGAQEHVSSDAGKEVEVQRARAGQGAARPPVRDG
jgi:hypothetical protein